MPRLAPRGAAGKAAGEMASGEAAADAPARSDRGERLKDEFPPLELRMGDSQAARAETTAAPEHEVEVEHARAPAPPGAPAELALDFLQAMKQCCRPGVALDQRDGIGEVATGAPVRRIEHDWRSVEQSEHLVEAGDRGLDNARGAAVPAVGAVGADRDRIEMGHGLRLASPPLDGEGAGVG